MPGEHFVFQLLGLMTLLFRFLVGMKTTHELDFDVQNIKFVTEIDDQYFLGFTLDSRMLVHHWKTVDLSNPKVLEMTRALAPAYLRVGGTDGDNLRFCPHCHCNKTNKRENTNVKESDKPVIITGCDIAELAAFTIGTDTKLIYGLNVLERNSKGHWDPTNALTLMCFMDNLGVDVAGWELGNEPRRFPIVYNKSISGEQLGKDFNILRKTLLQVPRYANALRLGPDITHVRTDGRSIRYLANVLKMLHHDTLSIATFHDYYFSGASSSMNDFLDIRFMNKLSSRIQSIKNTVRSKFPEMSIWIGETASAWGGGTPNISDRFVSTFMWLDKLGQSALHGISAVIRQVLLTPSSENLQHNYYGLIGPGPQYNPTPNYFISYVFKQLVGSTVLTPALEWKKYNAKLRIYVHCAKHFTGHSFEKNNNGIVIYGMNLNKMTFKINIKNSGARSNVTIEEFKITSPKGHLTSKYCYLNGRRMKVGPGGQPILLIPKFLQGQFLIQPNSLGFWVIRNVNLKFCQK